jgi:hypothetical protein
MVRFSVPLKIVLVGIYSEYGFTSPTLYCKSYPYHVAGARHNGGARSERSRRTTLNISSQFTHHSRTTTRPIVLGARVCKITRLRQGPAGARTNKVCTATGW